MFWTARAFTSRKVSLAAAALCAGSPIVLQYAQEVRVYVFAALAQTLAIGATVRASRQRDHRRALLTLGGAMAVLALWLHYVCALTIVPLCAWVALPKTLSRASRLAFLCACLAAGGLVLPIMLHQYQLAPNGGLVGIASLKPTNVWLVGATPFVARYVDRAGAIQVLGALITALCVLRLLTIKKPTIRHARFFGLLALVPVLVVVLLGERRRRGARPLGRRDPVRVLRSPEAQPCARDPHDLAAKADRRRHAAPPAHMADPATTELLADRSAKGAPAGPAGVAHARIPADPGQTVQDGRARSAVPRNSSSRTGTG